MTTIRTLTKGGLYRFINPRFPDGALDMNKNSKTAVVNYFMGTQTQRWEAKNTDDGYWNFKNVSTGLYLGVNLGDEVRDGNSVIGTENQFQWSVEEVKVKRESDTAEVTEFRLSVPFSTFLVEAKWNGDYPGTEVCFSSAGSQGWYNQNWRLSCDIEPKPPFTSGLWYKIICRDSGTIAHLENNGNVAGYVYNMGPNQVWEAIPHPSGPYMWSFKNVFNHSYLGIKKSQVAARGTRVAGVPNPFVWQVVVCGPDSFRLFVPYTKFNMDLDGGNSRPGTVIHLYDRTKKTWKRELVSKWSIASPLKPGPPDRK